MKREKRSNRVPGFSHTLLNVIEKGMHLISTGVFRSGRGVVVALALLLSAGLVPVLSCQAAEVLKADVSNTEQRFEFDVEMTVGAPAEHVWRVLTDFVHIYRLNPSIIESDVLPSPEPGVTRVRTVVRDCVFIICKRIERVEDVQAVGRGRLVTSVIGELSNIRAGSSSWRVLRTGHSTRVQYRGRVEFQEFIPPVIGTYLVRKKLLGNVTVSLANIERIAQIHARQGGDSDSAEFSALEILDEPPASQDGCAGARTANC